jgi:peptidoglycan glycosyltransferase
MASTPSYNLARVSTNFDAIRTQAGAPLLNRATAGRYPPGSTFKAVTADEALESGLYTPESTFDDTGSYVVHGQTIRNFGGETFGNNTLSDALTFSINTTFAKVGTALGAQRLGGAMNRLGFGTRPPIDLPQGEVLPSRRVGPRGGLLPNDQPGEDTARIAIGQERLGVTPLQMAMVAQAVANDGVLRAPYLLTRAVDRGGSIVHEQNPRDLGRAMSPQTASNLNAMMRRVVEEGTGTAAALSGLEVAGKTGTAETGNANLNDAWFIGFAPATDPEVAVAVVVENTSGEGGVVAAPIAAQVMKAAIG